ATCTDKTGGYGTAVFTVTLSNVVPIATLSNQGSVSEGSTASVFFTNPVALSLHDALPILHYAFDFNNDGTFEVGDGTYAGSGTSASAVVPASFLPDGPGVRVVHGRVIDKDGGLSDVTTAITITNVNPTVTAASTQAANDGS